MSFLKVSQVVNDDLFSTVAASVLLTNLNSAGFNEVIFSKSLCWQHTDKHIKDKQKTKWTKAATFLSYLPETQSGSERIGRRPH